MSGHLSSDDERTDHSNRQWCHPCRRAASSCGARWAAAASASPTPLTIAGCGGPVALKELFCDGGGAPPWCRHAPAHDAEAFAAAKTRFLREAAVLARFTHPGIVQLYEVFEESGTAYLVMELLEGRTLYDHVLAPRRTARRIGCARCRAPVRRPRSPPFTPPASCIVT